MSNRKQEGHSAGSRVSATAEAVEVVVLATTLLPPERKDLTEASVLELARSLGLTCGKNLKNGVAHGMHVRLTVALNGFFICPFNPCKSGSWNKPNLTNSRKHMIRCFHQLMNHRFPQPTDPKNRDPPSGPPSPVKKRPKSVPSPAERNFSDPAARQQAQSAPSTGVFLETSDHPEPQSGDGSEELDGEDHMAVDGGATRTQQVRLPQLSPTPSEAPFPEHAGSRNDDESDSDAGQDDGSHTDAASASPEPHDKDTDWVQEQLTGIKSTTYADFPVIAPELAPTLAEQGLRIVQPLGMLVCSKEQRLILTADVLRHLQHTHKVNLSRNVLANISAEISEHEPADVGWCTSYYDDRLASLANRNASTALPIWNVDIKPASVCLVPSCGFVTPKTRSDWTIKEHMTKRHPSYWSNLPNNARWRDGHCQAMSGQRDPGGAIYISVTITTADLPTLNQLIEVNATVEKLFGQIPTPTNANSAAPSRRNPLQFANPLTNVMRWNDMLSIPGYSGFDLKQFLLPAELQPDEAKETDYEAPHFKNGRIEVWLSAMRQYFGEICDSVDIAMRNMYHTTILRDANGSDGQVDQGLRRLTTEASQDRYGDTFAMLIVAAVRVAWLCRSGSDAEHPFASVISNEMADAILDALKPALSPDIVPTGGIIRAAFNVIVEAVDIIPERGSSSFKDLGIMRLVGFLLTLDVPKFQADGKKLAANSPASADAKEQARRSLTAHPPRPKQAYAGTSDLAKLMFHMRAHVLHSALLTIREYQSSFEYKTANNAQRATKVEHILAESSVILKLSPAIRSHAQIGDMLALMRNVAARNPPPPTMQISESEGDGSFTIILLNESNLSLSVLEYGRATHVALNMGWDVFHRIAGRNIDYTKVVSVDWDKLEITFPALVNVDPRNNTVPGTSILSLNGLDTDEYKQALARHLLNEFRLELAGTVRRPDGALPSLYVLGPTAQPEIDRSAIRAYLDEIARVRNVIFVLTQIIAGQPQRLTSIVKTRFANSAQGQLRNLMHVLASGNGGVPSLELQSGYHKGRNSGRFFGDTDTLHPLGAELGSLVLLLLVYINPFEVMLRSVLEPGFVIHPDFYEFLFVEDCKALTEERASDIFYKVTDQLFNGKRILPRVNRQVLVAMTASLRQQDSAFVEGTGYGILAQDDNFEDDGGEDEIDHLDSATLAQLAKAASAQRGHSTRTANTVYGQLTQEHVPGLASDRALAERRVPRRWEKLAMTTMRDRQAFRQLLARGGTAASWPRGALTYRNATDGSEVNMPATAAANQDSALLADSITRAAVSSGSTHVPSIFNTTIVFNGGKSDEQLPALSARQPFVDLNPLRDESLLDPGLDVEVRAKLAMTLDKPHLPESLDNLSMLANFRLPEQLGAASLMASGRAHVLNVSATGSGKTNVMAAAGAVRNGTIIVVTTHVIPRVQTIHVLRKTGKVVATWADIQSGVVTGAKFVVVPLEVVSTEAFTSFVSRVEVGAITIDEVHVLDLDHSFRKTLRDAIRGLRNIMKPSTPVWAFTATMSPSYTDDLCRLLRILPGPCHDDAPFQASPLADINTLPLKIVRTPTARHNVAIQVFNRPGSESDLVSGMITDAVKSFNQSWYSSSPTTTRAGATLFHLNSKASLRDVRRELLQQLRNKFPDFGDDAVAVLHANLSVDELPEGLRRRLRDSDTSHDSLTAKQALLDAVDAGNVQFVIATEAVGTGWNAIVRDVYVMGGTRSLESFSQLLGRAGRDGYPACCRVYTNSSVFRTAVRSLVTKDWSAKPTKPTDAFDPIREVDRAFEYFTGINPNGWQDRQVLKYFPCQLTTCRRRLLHGYLDGLEFDASNVCRDQLCDLCEGRIRSGLERIALSESAYGVPSASDRAKVNTPDNGPSFELGDPPTVSITPVMTAIVAPSSYPSAPSPNSNELELLSDEPELSSESYKQLLARLRTSVNVGSTRMDSTPAAGFHQELTATGASVNFQGTSFAAGLQAEASSISNAVVHLTQQVQRSYPAPGEVLRSNSGRRGRLPLSQAWMLADQSLRSGDGRCIVDFLVDGRQAFHDPDKHSCTQWRCKFCFALLSDHGTPCNLGINVPPEISSCFACLFPNIWHNDRIIGKKCMQPYAFLTAKLAWATLRTLRDLVRGNVMDDPLVNVFRMLDDDGSLFRILQNTKGWELEAKTWLSGKRRLPVGPTVINAALIVFELMSHFKDSLGALSLGNPSPPMPMRLTMCSV